MGEEGLIQQRFTSSIEDARRGAVRGSISADDVVRAHGMLVHAASIIASVRGNSHQ